MEPNGPNFTIKLKKEYVLRRCPKKNHGYINSLSDVLYTKYERSTTRQCRVCTMYGHGELSENCNRNIICIYGAGSGYE